MFPRPEYPSPDYLEAIRVDLLYLLRSSKQNYKALQGYQGIADFLTQECASLNPAIVAQDPSAFDLNDNAAALRPLHPRGTGMALNGALLQSYVPLRTSYVPGHHGVL